MFQSPPASACNCTSCCRNALHSWVAACSSARRPSAAYNSPMAGRRRAAIPSIHSIILQGCHTHRTCDWLASCLRRRCTAAASARADSSCASCCTCASCSSCSSSRCAPASTEPDRQAVLPLVRVGTCASRCNVGLKPFGQRKWRCEWPWRTCSLSADGDVRVPEACQCPATLRTMPFYLHKNMQASVFRIFLSCSTCKRTPPSRQQRLPIPVPPSPP